ncbi:rho GDP-dissociation inhibitor [Streptomyces sp. Je 1-79]|uniref:rho GDP-dissociation inhibitor n=1 Tax=Streptomyces sp. Je 1-79 TaxID=2943847 RepID=UPI0021A8B5DE|nr:rho GDP-dissociation inhibitor [Streptomyces sp. Je 1-79]MCT4354037.1 rho GDP-dissociation inhibitor [Streptomyces sp. Je 1-79]
MASLADTAPAVPPRERSTVRLLGLQLQFTGHEDISVPVPPSATTSAPFTVKEGTECRAVIRFQVDGTSVTGLKVVDVRHREGAELGGREVALGDFRHGGPYELALPPERVPNGPRARGLYEVEAALVDGEGRVLDRSGYRFEVRRDWKPLAA